MGHSVRAGDGARGVRRGRVTRAGGVSSRGERAGGAFRFSREETARDAGFA